MDVSSINATASDVPTAPVLPSSNQFDPLEGPPCDEEATKSHPRFQAQGVYKPPHMRTPTEPTASVTEIDPTASGTATVHPEHGPSIDRDGKGASRPSTPNASSEPGLAAFGFDEMKKKIHEELLIVRKAAEEMEMIEKEFLEEEARFGQNVQALRSGGLTDEQIRIIMDWHPPKLPSRPPTVQPLDVNSVMVDLARVDLDTEQEVVGTREKKSRQTEEDSANKTPIPGGPIYSSANHPGGVHQTGTYGSSGPSSITQTTNTHQDALMRQTTIWNEQLHPYYGVTGRHGSTPSGTFQMPGQIYQATPGGRFNRSVDSLPPRFRQQQPLLYHQPVPLHHQNIIQRGPKDVVQVGHLGPWPPAPSRPQSSVPNHTFRPSTIPPPPPRPYRYEVDLVFDFEGVALSSNCNRDVFVKTYWKKNGFSPSQGAWAAWAGAVERVKLAEQYELQKATERETRERYGAGSRLTKWASKLLLDLPGSEPSYSSSSSDASTKVASSRTSEAGDEGSVMVNAAGPNGGWAIARPRAEKRWKDVADKTWAFGEPPRLDDLEYYMTHVVEKPGWQVHDARPEQIILSE